MRLTRTTTMVVIGCLGAVWLGAATAPAAAPIKVHCPVDNLQAAIDSAPAGAVIHVAGTCTGNFTIAKDLTLVGTGAATLNGNFAGRVVYIPDGTAAATTITLQNLTFTNGNINACACGPYGPGIYNGGANLTVKGSTITNNTGSPVNYGAGIYSDGTLLVKNSTITANGPAVNGAGIANDGVATIVNSTISGNIGDGGNGAGITSFGSSLTVTGSTVSGNTGAGSGAAIYAGNGTVSIDSSTLTNNNALEYGGGIFVADNTVVSLTGSTVNSNTAGIDGGGIYVALAGTISLTSSTVTNNLPDNCAPSGAVGGCSG